MTRADEQGQHSAGWPKARAIWWK